MSIRGCDGTYGSCGMRQLRVGEGGVGSGVKMSAGG